VDFLLIAFAAVSLRIYVTIFNCAGVDEENDPTSPLEVVLKDSHRIKYHLDYLSYVNAAIRYYDGTDPILIQKCFRFSYLGLYIYTAAEALNH